MRPTVLFVFIAAAAVVALAQEEFAQDAPAPVPAPEPQVAEIAAADTGGIRGISLRGTLVSSDAAFSRAILSFAPNDARIVAIGAKLPRLGVLMAIESKHIVVRRGGAFYEFSFNDSDADGRGGGAGVRIGGTGRFTMPDAQPQALDEDPATVNWDRPERRNLRRMTH